MTQRYPTLSINVGKYDGVDVLCRKYVRERRPACLVGLLVILYSDDVIVYVRAPIIKRNTPACYDVYNDIKSIFIHIWDHI